MSHETIKVEPWGDVQFGISYDGTTDWMSPLKLRWREIDGRDGFATLPFGLFQELAKREMRLSSETAQAREPHLDVFVCGVCGQGFLLEEELRYHIGQPDPSLDGDSHDSDAWSKRTVRAGDKFTWEPYDPRQISAVEVIAIDRNPPMVWVNDSRRWTGAHGELGMLNFQFVAGVFPRRPHFEPRPLMEFDLRDAQIVRLRKLLEESLLFSRPSEKQLDEWREWYRGVMKELGP